MSASRFCVLIVDDEFLITEALRAQVEDMGIEVCGTAASADEAIALAQTCRPSLVLMDMRLQGKKDGVDAALAIGEILAAKMIFITGSKEPATIARINSVSPYAILFKPIASRQFRATIEAVRKSLEDGSGD